MPTAENTLIDLEEKFWQSMVDEDTDTALSLLAEPALMVTAQGALQFDHVQYRTMAEQGSMVIKSFELSDMNVMFPREDIAVLTYRVRQAMAARGEPDDEAVEQLMADSSVWMRQGGEWRCFMHTEAEIEDDEDDDSDEE
jgi:hypothetical protein